MQRYTMKVPGMNNTWLKYSRKKINDRRDTSKGVPCVVQFFRLQATVLHLPKEKAPNIAVKYMAKDSSTLL